MRCPNGRWSASSKRRRTTRTRCTSPRRATSTTDTRPYLYKTADGGKTWRKLSGAGRGIADGEFTRTIREDPSRKGLLYCGTETSIYVSFDEAARGIGSPATCRSCRSTI
jgi:photosystem II stability/assembly factor-like uncharacterized protein